MRKVAILGYGAVPVGIYPDHTELELALKVTKLALEDSGLNPNSIQGIFTSPSPDGYPQYWQSQICQQLMISPKIIAEINYGGLSAGLCIRAAFNEIALGNIELALCLGVDRESSRRLFKRYLESREAIWGDPFSMQLHCPNTAISLYALSATEYMHKYGAGEEHFALAVVRDRKNALNNPYASESLRKQISLEDVLKSRVLSWPLKLLDCSFSMDGAAALILGSQDILSKIDLAHDPIWIWGIGQHHEAACWFGESLTEFPAVKIAARDAYTSAGVAPGDIDVAEIYAPFSPFELMIPEDLGFFRKGEGIQAMEQGSTEIHGQIPINTDGGLLGRGHPWAVSPFLEFIAILRQLRAEMGSNQVTDAEIGLVQLEGAGVFTNVQVFILSNRVPK